MNFDQNPKGRIGDRAGATGLGPATPPLARAVDLHELIRRGPYLPDGEFLVEGLIPDRRNTGLVAFRGAGKSLIALEIACGLATGSPVFGQPATRGPIHVVYMDYEMGELDLYERLSDFGYALNHPDLELLTVNLHYYQLPDLPPLDTPDGGDALVAIVQQDDASVVVIDTVSRVISGDENDAGPFRALFRHTETKLKRMGVPIIRLDHEGKKAEAGSRGSSAKEDPLDLILHLKPGKADTLNLKITKGRMPGIPESATLRRVYAEDGSMRHLLEIDAPPHYDEICSLLDDLVVRRGFDDPVEGGSASCDAFDDLFGGAGPHEWFGVVVPVLDPPVDAVLEVAG